MDFLRKLGIKLLSALVVLSSLSWTVQEHHGMGSPVDFSVFGESQGCGMEIEDSIPRQSDDKKNSCCDDQVVVFDSQNQFKLNKDHSELSLPVHDVCWYYVYGSFLLASADLIPTAEYPPPPLLVKDIQLLDEVFLI